MKFNWKWVLLAVVIMAALYWQYSIHQVSKIPADDPAHQQRKAERQKRLSDWAYIAKEKQVSPSETVKLLIVPGKFGEFDDTKCLIYLNSEFKQSSMICPDADKDSIAELQDEGRPGGIGGTNARGAD